MDILSQVCKAMQLKNTGNWSCDTMTGLPGGRGIAEQTVPQLMAQCNVHNFCLEGPTSTIGIIFPVANTNLLHTVSSTTTKSISTQNGPFAWI